MSALAFQEPLHCPGPVKERHPSAFEQSATHVSSQTLVKFCPFQSVLTVRSAVRLERTTDIDSITSEGYPTETADANPQSDSPCAKLFNHVSKLVIFLGFGQGITYKLYVILSLMRLWIFHSLKQRHNLKTQYHGIIFVNLCVLFMLIYDQ